MNQTSPFIIFTDFDGTISSQDVCDNLFFEFGDFNKVSELYSKLLERNITAIDFWEKSYSTIENLTVNKIENFIKSQSIDSTFFNFCKFCEINKISLNVLSDGMDFYIKSILEKYKIDLPIYANSCKIIDGKIIPQFPFTDSECKNCANCKRNHLLTKSRDEQIIILIGNGNSDFCPAHFADIVFAKEELLKYCEKENITYHPYKNFLEIELLLQKIIQAKPKHRQSALHARKSVFITE
ncbi:MAG: MtnX-like HAD-IB family phosphatase [Bacteroidetes bacterium]|nr:MtnX-like HAD-IB family phosphatase [Bacteroidota bacterium]